jgi:hypothetical protein
VTARQVCHNDNAQGLVFVAATIRPCDQWTAQTPTPHLSHAQCQELANEQCQRREAMRSMVLARTSFVLLDMGLALIGANSPKYNVHILQTATFGLRKEPSEID